MVLGKLVPSEWRPINCNFVVFASGMVILKLCCFFQMSIILYKNEYTVPLSIRWHILVV